MRSFARHVWAACAVALLCAPGGAFAQTTAASRYSALHGEEMRLLDSPAAALVDLRAIVGRYWAFVRRYPTSGYSDNALFQAAGVSLEAFRRFGEPADRDRALELLQWLTSQYPRSSLRTQASQEINRLGSTQPFSTLLGIRRELLPEVVRITIEMDHEARYSEERSNATRVEFELQGTRPAASLGEGVYRFKDDVVREIRVARLDKNATRVLLDFRDDARYSVFTLYSPYRVVIDADRRTVTIPVLIAGSRLPPPPARAGSVPLKVLPLVVTPPPRPAPVVAATPVQPAIKAAGAAATKKPSSEAPAVLTRPTPVPPPAPAASTTPVLTPTTVLPPAPVSPSANVSGSFSVARQLGLGVSRIVIDPGHGGHDPGASALGVSEAELVLDVALRLEKLLRQEPAIDVVLTRRTNEFVTLEARTEIANKQSADLFLSIHANASDSVTAKGIETYFLNFALNRQAEAVAARENAASGRTMSSLPGIIKAITLNNKLNESRDFASLIQQSLVRGVRGSNRTVRDLGVKQAPFMVLIGASMPSALAEIAFVTNRQEAALLKTPAYRQKLAESLLSGIVKYQDSLKKVETASLSH